MPIFFPFPTALLRSTGRHHDDTTSCGMYSGVATLKASGDSKLNALPRSMKRTSARYGRGWGDLRAIPGGEWDTKGIFDDFVGEEWDQNGIIMGELDLKWW